jgi:3-methyladenine DNA glycosylase AlkD
MRDEAYGDFCASLMPTVERSRVIGVRTPELRKYAKSIPWEDAVSFMRALPHEYYEEDNLHAALIDRIRDLDTAVTEIERFLPFVDNWATCDSMRPKVFKRHTDALFSYVLKWMKAEHTYTKRYALGMLCSYYLDEAFSPSQLEMAAGVVSDEYYVNMMTAWYFATALAKQREATLPYFTERRLHEPVFSMARRKCFDSYRISQSDKELLREIK